VAALFHGAIASYVLHNGDVALIGASGAISGILGVAAVAGNTRAYYWLVLQIIFAVIGSISALPIAFTAHVGGFVAGAGMTKVLVRLEQTKRKSRYIFCSHEANTSYLCSAGILLFILINPTWSAMNHNFVLF
jgi:membrane associated rhomboid family serine protease